MNCIFFDTETTGVPRNYNAPITDVDNWPRLVQLGWIVFNEAGEKLGESEFIVLPEGFEISAEVSKIHGITQERALEDGWPLADVLAMFLGDLLTAETVVGHNLSYDAAVIGAEFVRLQRAEFLAILGAKSQICTMKSSTNYCKIPGGRPYK